ncbi:MAG TPA: hypothetical protein VN837_02175 [Chloroflexota bacterium]|nr:hypothetical protein [Chloroflexota bacterium]
MATEAATAEHSRDHARRHPAPVIEGSATGPARDLAAGAGALDLLRTNPRAASPAAILALQRVAGNQAVSALIRARPAPVTIQRLAYTSVAGDTWRTIGARYGIREADRARFEAMLTRNGRAWVNRGDTLRVGMVIQIPDRRGTVTPVTTPSTTPSMTPSTATPAPTVPTTGSVSSVLGGIGAFADWAAPKPGSKAALSFAFRWPIYEGTAVGGRFTGEVERNDEENGAVPTKISGKLEVEGRVKVPYYGEIDLSAALGGIITAESKAGGRSAMESVSFAMYRQAQETYYVPARVMGWIWGASRDSWAQGVAGRMAANEDKVLIGVVAEASGKIKEAEGAESEGNLGVKAQYIRGTEYNKESITQQGEQTSAGYRGRYASSLSSTEKSLGETKNSFEIAIEGGGYGFTGGYKHAYEDGAHKGELTVSVDLKGKGKAALESETGKSLVEKTTAKLGQASDTLGPTLASAVNRTSTAVGPIIAEALAMVRKAGAGMGSILPIINRMQALGFSVSSAATIIKSALDGFTIPESVQGELDNVEADNEAKLEIKFEFAYSKDASGSRPKAVSISLGGKLGVDSLIATAGIETSRRLYKKAF